MRSVGILVLLAMIALVACSPAGPGSSPVVGPTTLPSTPSAAPQSELPSELPFESPLPTIPTSNGGITSRDPCDLLSAKLIERDAALQVDFTDASIGLAEKNGCDWQSSAPGSKNAIMLFLGPRDFAKAHWTDPVLTRGGVEVSGIGDRAVVATYEGGADWTVMGVELAGGGFSLHAFPAISADQIEQLARDVIANLAP